MVPRGKRRRLNFENLEGRDLFAVALNPYFGIGGSLQQSLPSGGAIQAVAVEGNGKMVAAGISQASANFGDNDILVERFLPSGFLDPTFGFGGQMTTHLQDPVSTRDVAVQADGSIVVLGDTPTGNMVVARYSSNGSLDPTFDGDGIYVALAPSGLSFQAAGIEVPGDQKLVFAGSYSGPTGSGFSAVRLNADGSLDPTFGTQGQTGYGLTGVVLSDITLQSDGKLLLAGSVITNTIPAFVVARLQADGALDTSFNQSGVAYPDFGGPSGLAQTVFVQDDGKIVVGGSIGSNGVSDFGLARFNADGTADSSFGMLGTLTTAFGNTGSVSSLMQQADGKLVALGSVGTVTGIARYNVDGSLDATFDQDGKATFGPGYDVPVRGVMTITGAIVAGGFAYVGTAFQPKLTQYVEVTPTITSLVVPPDATEGDRLHFSVHASEPNHRAFSIHYGWTITGPHNFVQTLVGANVRFVAPDNGTYHVTAFAMDSELAATSETTDLVVDNAPPFILSITLPSSLKAGVVSRLGVTAVDPAGANDRLVFTWTITGPAGYHVILHGARPAWKAPTKVGTYTIVVSVSDGDGGSYERDPVKIVIAAAAKGAAARAQRRRV